MPFTELKNQDENVLVLFSLGGWRGAQVMGRKALGHGNMEK